MCDFSFRLSIHLSFPSSLSISSPPLLLSFPWFIFIATAFFSKQFHLMDVREPCWLCIVPFWFLSLLWWKSYLNSSLFPFWPCHIFIVTGFCTLEVLVGGFAKWTEMVQRAPLKYIQRERESEGESKVFVLRLECMSSTTTTTVVRKVFQNADIFVVHEIAKHFLRLDLLLILLFVWMCWRSRSIGV